MRRAGLVLAGCVAVFAGLAPAAGAHVQISPKVVAPDDPVKFTILVPGEREAQTTKVAIKMPSGLLPFSYEDTPGWTRSIVKASNGGVDQLVYTGRLAKDGFAEFSFLAGTPTKPGTMAFKALQTYSDGTIVRWIGSPGSEQPAPVVQVVKGAERENAGGEGGAGASSPQASATAPTTAASPAAAVAAAAISSPGGADWVARILAIIAIVLLVGVIVLLRQRTRSTA